MCVCVCVCVCVKSNHIFLGEEFKTKIHYPTVKTQERIINPPKKKKKNYDKERESVGVCVLTYSSVGNMD